jgi:protein arginine kinase activator
LLRVVDGQVTHTHLCPSCAENLAEETEGMALVLAVPSVLRQMGRTPATDDVVIPSVDSEHKEHYCEVCGTTLTDLKESGLVGCSNCYRVFEDHLETLLAGGAEPVEHLGKIPHRGPETDNLRHEILRLQRMLRELVEHERFEEAASVRDRLTELGERLGEDAQ